MLFAVTRCWFGSPSCRPNSQTTPFAWPLFNSTTQLNMNLSWPLTVKANLLEQKCGFWDKLMQTLRMS